MVALLRRDIDWQPRAPPPADAGCDEASDAPAKRRPLSAEDVGPSWMSPADRADGGARAPSPKPAS